MMGGIRVVGGLSLLLNSSEALEKILAVDVLVAVRKATAKPTGNSSL